MIKPQHRWKLHPQPSSLRKARGAVRALDERIGLKGKRVLDPFVGTGTLLIAVAEVGGIPLGSDIEDWSDYLRPGARPEWFTWGIDALEAVRRFDYDVLFTDPPNPHVLVGGRLISAYRDTGVTGAQLARLLRLSKGNLMGKSRALKLTKATIEMTLDRGAVVVVNAFGPYWRYLSKFFTLEQLYETWVLVRASPHRTKVHSGH